ncbi:MAG: right-handed parallel beta-helix repeat-containing protein [Candidatus Sumerlaeota bacterium]|nr:right-handed parallel beta-helix repeat-containing protein [Candidatus Sumerlaeota bacterium]
MTYHRSIAMSFAGSILLLSLCASAALAQGPLTPPGPPLPTMKSLDEIYAQVADGTSNSRALLASSEPRVPVTSDTTPGDATSMYIISQPGSYYLRSNIMGVAGMNGIKITTGNVSLDLSGFAVQGVEGVLSGIYAPVDNLTIVNGVVSGWNPYGIYAGNGCRIEGIKANKNGFAGIYTGAYCVVRQCQARQNTYPGISVGNGSYVGECTSYDNGGTGISWTGPCVIARNTCTYNAYGINQGSGGGALISENTCYYNTGHGISVVAYNLIIKNNCSNNGTDSGSTGAGIDLRMSSNCVDGNLCISNEVGIQSGANNKNLVIRNMVGSNSVADFQIGSGNHLAPAVTVGTATNPFSNLLMN